MYKTLDYSLQRLLSLAMRAALIELDNLEPYQTMVTRPVPGYAALTVKTESASFSLKETTMDLDIRVNLLTFIDYPEQSELPDSK